MLTPSYAASLTERADLTSSSVQRVLVAGEPGGGEPAFRAALEEGWGAQVTEAMGIGDVGVSLWGECAHQDGMHLGARGFVHAELIDPETHQPIPLDNGASGELVLTHLKHRAAPLLRFRTRDHVRVKTSPCPRAAAPARASAASAVPTTCSSSAASTSSPAPCAKSSAFAPDVSGHILVRPRAQGVKQDPPLPVSVELAHDAHADERLADSIRERLRAALVVQTRIDLVPWGTLQRSEYKSKLVEHDDGRPTT